MGTDDYTLERKKDLLRLIASLDISKTLYDNAVEKYTSLGKYLNEQEGIKADIYPQGSFALRTVVRPFANGDDASYDLDFICQVNSSRKEITPNELREKILEVLQKNKVYSDRLHVDETCFTISYADIGTFGFSIDVVPAVDELENYKEKLQSEAEKPELVDTSIAIPKKDEEKHRLKWVTSNPKGYISWFNSINDQFSKYSSALYKSILTENARAINEEIEEVPELSERTSLQVIIQLLKYHRDVYYYNLNRTFGRERYIKPISAIINTLATKVAVKADPASDIFSLLGFVLTELSVYSDQQSQLFEEFSQNHLEKDLIERTASGWVIKNPSNPDDNLADSWDLDDAKVFFRWLNAAKNDLIDSLNERDSGRFRVITENAFSEKLVKSVWGNKYVPNLPKATRISAEKPWHCD